MPFVDDVNRILRDFEGYTGDGQGGVGDLPVGDRSTSRKPITKRDLRTLLIQVAQTLGDPSALQAIIDDLDAQEEAFTLHVNNSANPHGVTKVQIGLGNADNTSDADKPVSNAQQQAIDYTKSLFVWASLQTETVKVDYAGRRVKVESLKVFTTKLAGREVKMDAGGRTGTGGAPYYVLNTGTNYTTDPSLAAVVQREIHHNHAIGQSFTQGSVATEYSTTALHSGVALMLSPGVMPLGQPAEGFGDLVASSGYEPPVLSAVNYMVGALESALGSSPKMVATVSAFGGKPYFELMRGSSRWRESLRIFREVSYFAQLENLKPVLSVLHMHEGEADAAQNATVEQTVGHIMRWRQDHQEMAEIIYGQERQCVAVLHCTSASYYSGSLRMTPWQAACQEAARRAPHLFVVAAPTYAVEIEPTANPNGNHPTVTGYRRLGEMMGRAALASYYGTGFQPVQVISHKWLSSTSIRLDCAVPFGGNIEIDTTFDIVSDVGASKGFSVETPSGDIAVTAVSTLGKSITLTLASAASVGATRVGYAVESGSGAYSGDNTNGARGNLRGTVTHALAGSAVASNDWLLPFTMDI
ncbi:hypothetical protein [Sulfitobacter sp. HI0054]|uniref:hypothetical protein n=2 Tax=Sulfitobacter sp. HI0054 TaxID=1822238 RepID=UPI000AD7A460|nr:hypothetical protein [Sulfitobacter sp. HI0054]